MKTILEFLLGKDVPKNKHIDIDPKIIDHENDEVDPHNYNSYIDFFHWLLKAIKEYGDLTDEECEFFRPNGDHLTLYSDGAITLSGDGKRLAADFNISDRKTTFKKLYDKILEFINENIDMMK